MLKLLQLLVLECWRCMNVANNVWCLKYNTQPSRFQTDRKCFANVLYSADLVRTDPSLTPSLTSNITRCSQHPLYQILCFLAVFLPIFVTERANLRTDYSGIAAGRTLIKFLALKFIDQHQHEDNHFVVHQRTADNGQFSQYLASQIVN